MEFLRAQSFDFRYFWCLGKLKPRSTRCCIWISYLSATIKTPLQKPITASDRVTSGYEIASPKPLIHVVYVYEFIMNHPQTVSECIHTISNRFPGIYDVWIDGFSLGTRSLWTRDVITPLTSPQLSFTDQTICCYCQRVRRLSSQPLENVGC